MDLTKQAIDIFQAALAAVQPAQLIGEQLRLVNGQLCIGEQRFELGRGKIYVIGAGKASAHMARALEGVLGEHIAAGLVTVKYGHRVPCRRVSIREAGHPLTDRAALEATAVILAMLQQCTAEDLVICLLSGGGSALLEQLPGEIALEALQETMRQLLACGATIHEINAVRKHLSRVKGGQLAQAVAPARCLSLIISDVIGDDLDVIASGPTAPDSSSFADALAVLEKYHLTENIPAAVLRHLRRGEAGKAAETGKPGDPVFAKVENIILGNNRRALAQAEAAAQRADYRTLVLSSRIQGEAREVAKVLAAVVQEIAASGQPLSRPAALLFGGETTVTVRGKGKGGRNQELALAALLALEGLEAPYAFLSGGTDGTDGPTDAAGAVFGPAIWEQIRAKQFDPRAFLADNDAYHFFEPAGGLLKTGPTGTNVMDIGIVLLPG